MRGTYNLETWDPRGVRQPLFQVRCPSCVTQGLWLSLSELQFPIIIIGAATPHPT